MNQKGSANIILIAAVVILAGFVVYLSLPDGSTPPPLTDETADWKLYRNDKIGIEFKYPSSWKGIDSSSSDPQSLIVICRESDIGNDPDCDFNLVAVAPDLEEGGSKGVSILYLGSSSDRKRLSCSFYSIKYGCETFEIQGRKAIRAFETGGGSSELQTRKIVLIENTGQKFTGISITNYINSFRLTSVNDPEANAAYDADVTKKISKNEFSAEDKNDLEIFDRIVSTIKFIR